MPDGLCDDITKEVAMCATNIATAWAVGGDEVSKERSRTAKYFKKKTISC